MDARYRPDATDAAEDAELAIIRAQRPFAALDESRFAALGRAAGVYNLPTRATLAAEGARADFLYVVLKGCVELYTRANDREATTGIVRVRGFFPLSAVVRDLPCLTSARTCAASRLLLLPSTDVRAAIDDAGFARALVGELVDRHRAEFRAHKEIKLRSATQRLANRLLRYEREQGSRGLLTLPCDKRTLASLLTMTPENLSRAFATLGTVGVVVDGPTITLSDRSALVAFACPDPLIDECATGRHHTRDA